MLLEDLVDAAGMPEKNVKSGMVALTKAGLVVRNDDTWVVPTWKKRQFESDDTASRTAKHRSKERSNDDDVTHQITETDTEAELVNSSPPPTSSVADSVVAVNGLQDLLVGEGFEPGDVAIVMRKLDNRQRFGERVKDPVEWSRPQIEKLAKARIAASRNGNGAHPKRVEVDGETFELVEGQWQAVAS